MKMGREPGRDSPKDPPPNVVDEALFRRLVQLEINKARRLQYSVSLVCVTPTEGEEGIDQTFARRVTEAVSRQFRTTDVLTARAPASIWLLLVNADTRDLPEIFRRTATELEAQTSATGVTRPITWGAGASCYPRTATSEIELVGQAAEAVRRARLQGVSTLVLPPRAVWDSPIS